MWTATIGDNHVLATMLTGINGRFEVELEQGIVNLMGRTQLCGIDGTQLSSEIFCLNNFAVIGFK